MTSGAPTNAVSPSSAIAAPNMAASSDTLPVSFCVSVQTVPLRAKT